MKYDPIKRTLGKYFDNTPFLRKIFYKLLDLLLLRTWHVKREIRKFTSGIQKEHPISVLDAGSGFGQYSYYLASHFKNWKIKAVDVKEEQIEDCRNFFNRAGLDNTTFEIADLTKFTEAEQYELVISIDVMEHIEEDVLVFENFNKSMKKGGMLLISTPSDKGGSDVHHHEHEDYSNDGTHSFIDEHVRDGYNIEEIQKKLKKAGFTKTEAAYSYGPPGNISWRLSMKYPIMMLNISKVFFILLPVYYIITFPFCLILNKLDVTRKHKTGTGLIVKAWK